MPLSALKRTAEGPSWGKMFSSWLREASLLMNLFVKGSGEGCLSKAWFSSWLREASLLMKPYENKIFGVSENVRFPQLFVKGSGVLI